MPKMTKKKKTNDIEAEYLKIHERIRRELVAKNKARG